VCNLCNGTNRVTYENSFGAYVFQACPSCGPVPDHIRKAKREVLNKRLAEAEKRFDLEDQHGGDAA
jgi:phage FluMu protein Com